MLKGARFNVDFCEIKVKTLKNGTLEVYPAFKVMNSKDLLVRGGRFYAIWDEDAGRWSTDILDVQRLIDKEIYKKRDEMIVENPVFIKTLGEFESLKWTEFNTYMTKMPDSKVSLNQKPVFADTPTNKEDYSSVRLNYSLAEGDISSYLELVSILYDDEERQKFEWAIGSILAGDSIDIQKFEVFFGPPGCGKGTVLQIIDMLFKGYTAYMDIGALASKSDLFSTEQFGRNPLVAIQTDGDLSRIEDNTKLNSIVSHETITVNEKFKSKYSIRSNCFLFMASNKPVMITDALSGISRRLIDIRPTGNKVNPKKYHELMDNIKFEIGAIAYHCLDVYKKLGKYYYDDYVPIDMMFRTDYFFNFVEDSFNVFSTERFVTLKQAYELYIQFCNESALPKRMPKFKFRDELKNYFEDFKEQVIIGNDHFRNCYFGFKVNKFMMASKVADHVEEEKSKTLIFDKTESLFDKEFADCLAQYAIDRDTQKEIPKFKWENVMSKLKNLDTTKVHFVKLPEDIIFIDFDLKDENGKKCKEKNLEAASKFPPTYGEFSKGGEGVHLIYRYSGDVSKLSALYSEGIEIKTSVGNSSMRRRLSYCNDIPIRTINSGLPLKEEKKAMMTDKAIKTELSLRRLILRCLKKEFGSTTQNINFIYDILKECYESGMSYDVSDMYYDVYNFAINSTNQSATCCKKVDEMKFKSDETEYKELDSPIVFYDVEVFPNLFVVVYKAKDSQPVILINPKPQDIQAMMQFNLVGFNCRRYDNHIIYACFLGYSNEQLFDLSQKIINAAKGSKNASFFGEAYNISYTDIYDYCAKKQSLKKWEIELGIHHQELGLPWDKPVPEELWAKVAEYCVNDVNATEAVWDATQGDFLARQILADIAGMTVNDTTNSLTTRIIFGKEKNPQSQFFYRNLAENGGDGYFCYKDFLAGKDCRGKKPYFPGYSFDCGKSTYRGEEIGEGGKVYAEPGMYSDIPVLDVASMHPHSVIAEMLFGKYTENFIALVNTRIDIKHGEFDKAKRLFDGKLEKWLTNKETAKALSQALKIAINSVYGLTSASFVNPFRDPRNIDNIVAKRGALFMTDLKFAVQEKGFKVAHIKTDSIKIPGATPEIIEFVKKMGEAYGYTFEIENEYEKMCLVNDAVYIAKHTKEHEVILSTGQKVMTQWEATGKQFAEPYVFKTLFAKLPLIFEDYAQVKQVQTALYLDYNEQLGEDEHNYVFIGKTGSFVPVVEGSNGGQLMRYVEDDKYSSAVGTKGYRWMESEAVRQSNLQNIIDISYFNRLADEAKEEISQYGDFEWFAN